MHEPDAHAATCTLSLDAATLSAARDELLPADELRRVRAHAPTCPACQNQSAAFDAMAHALLTQRELEPGDRILARVLTAAPRDTAHPATPVRPRLPRWPRPQRPWRQLPRARRWGGLAAMAAVAAVLLLFAYVLASGLPLRGPTAHATPAHSPLATAYPSPYPTPTPLPNSPLWSIQQAWGAGGVAARFSTQLDPAHIFEAHAITPDGRTLIGLVFTVAADGSMVYPSQVQTGMLDVTTRQFTPFGVSAPGTSPPSYVTNDSRFVIVFDDTQPGATCGICHRRYWSYDLTTHALRQIGVGVNLMFVGHGTAILIPVFSQPQTIQADDLATGAITAIATGTAALSPVVIGYSWPDVFYTDQPNNPPSNATATPYPVHVYNAQSGTDTALPARTSTALRTALASSAGAYASLAVLGDTLIFIGSAPVSASASTGNAASSVRAFSSCPQCTPTPGPPGPPAPPPFNQTTVYTLDHFLDPGAQPRQVAAFVTGSGDAISLFPAGDTVFIGVMPDTAIPGNANRVVALYAVSHASNPTTHAFALLASSSQLGAVTAANDRLVTFGAQLVFDRAEGRLVGLMHNSPLGIGAPIPGTDLAGTFLLVAQPISRNVPSADQVTIYNTALLPIQSG